MIHFLFPTDKNANWEDDFYLNLRKGFVELGITTIGIHLEQLVDLTEQSYVIVTDFKDLKKISELKSQIKAKIIAQSNGSAVNYYAYNVNKEEERHQVCNVVDINLMNSPTQEQLMRQKYPDINRTIVSGFPLNFTKYAPYIDMDKKKKIVIGGRISPDKQFYLSTFLLKDLVDEYEIVFTVVDKDNKWSDLYDIERFKDMGYRIEHCPTSEGFYNELRDAEIFFTASLGDTISIAMAEAALIGCYIVAPRIEGMFPMWNDYYSGGYEPFSKSGVEYLVRNKPKYDIDLSLFNYKNVCQKIKDELSL